MRGPTPTADSCLSELAGYVGIRAILSLIPDNIPRIGAGGSHVGLDWRVLAFTMGLSIVTGILFGLVPALESSRADLSRALKESNNRSGTGLRHNQTRALLVAAQMALAVVLLIGAALLIRSFIAIRQVNPGFDAHNVLTMRMALTFNRRRWERQMDAEFQFHLESQIDDYVEQGLSRRDAESRARREFGGLDLAKEECRDQRLFESFDHVMRDLLYASRSLRQSPGFAVAAILTLALAIGANTAIFSALEGAVLAPLPYHDPDRLVFVALYNPTLKSPTLTSYPDFLDWQRSSRSFEQIAAFRDQGFDLTSPGKSEHVGGMRVSSNFFRTLGENLALGSELSTHPSYSRRRRSGH